MFEKLKARWKVNGTTLLLILCTFALGGSLCAFAGRKLLVLAGAESGPIWVVPYIFIVTLLWPLCVLLISIPFGQFSFFIAYLTKIWKRMTGGKQPRIPIAIFASGAGSNAENIIDWASREQGWGRGHFSVDLIVCNKPGAGVLRIAATHGVDTLLIEKERCYQGDGYVKELTGRGIQWIVLAGFLWKIPVALINAYPGRIINIHPALLPKFGGKGMYGDRVHEAVLTAGEKESGITIHYVDELYDHGNIIFQAHCPVAPGESVSSLAQKIHALEHRYYPEVIDGLLKIQNSVKRAP